MNSLYRKRNNKNLKIRYVSARVKKKRWTKSELCFKYKLLKGRYPRTQLLWSRVLKWKQFTNLALHTEDPL